MRNVFLFFALVVLLRNLAAQTIIWSDDFSDPTTWSSTIATDAPNVPWVIGTQMAQGPISSEMGPFNSTTAPNGFALMDSDFLGSELDYQNSMLTTAAPIDLSTQQQVLLQFESFYRKWTDNSCYVVLSTTNADWPSYSQLISNDSNIFELHRDLGQFEVSADPKIITLDISQFAGGQSQVWIRFHWYSEWAYAWYLDDVRLLEQFDHDLMLEKAYVSHDAGGSTYGRVPSDQLINGLIAKVQYQNWGYAVAQQDQLRTVIKDSTGSVQHDEWIDIPLVLPTDTLDFVGPLSLAGLSTGLYTAEFELASDEEVAIDPNWGSNTFSHAFEVSNSRYSLDYIGGHLPDQQLLGALGTTTFNGIDDGMMCFTRYVVHQPLLVNGIEILLGEETEVGANVIVAVHDSAAIIGDLSFENPDLASALATSTLITIAASDLANGKLTISFDQPVILPTGSYYAAVELYSGANADPISIMDDLTVPQPAEASLIYAPTDNTIYTNGNAFAIRLVIEAEPATCQAGFNVMQGMTLPDSVPVPGLLWIIDTSSGGSGIYSYSWNMGDGTVYDEPTPFHDFATNGPYNVCLTVDDGQGCVSTHCHEITVDEDGNIFGMLPGGSVGFSVQVYPQQIITDVGDAGATNELVSWPNPVQEILNFRSDLDGDLNVQIIDQAGRTIWEQRQIMSADQIAAIPVTWLATGVYILKLLGNKEIMTSKFVKQ